MEELVGGLNVPLTLRLTITAARQTKRAASVARHCSSMIAGLSGRLVACTRLVCLTLKLVKVVTQGALTQPGVSRCSQLQLARSLLEELTQRQTFFTSAFVQFSQMVPGPALPKGWETWYEDFRGSAGRDHQIFELAEGIQLGFTIKRERLKSLETLLEEQHEELLHLDKEFLALADRLG